MMRQQHNMTVDDDGTFRCTRCGRTWDEPETEMIDGECNLPKTSFTVNVVGVIGPDGVMHPIEPGSIVRYIAKFFEQPKKTQTPEEKGNALASAWIEGEGAEAIANWIEEEGSDE